MEKFKVGDKVRCLFDNGHSQLVAGQIYTVSVVTTNTWHTVSQYIGLKELGETESEWGADRFELFEEKPKMLVDKEPAKVYYAMFNKTTMEIKCLSLTKDQLASKITTTKSLQGFEEKELWLDI